MSQAWVVAGHGELRAVDSAAPPPEEQEIVVAVEAAQVPRAHLQPGVTEVPGWAAVGRVVAAGEQALALLEQRVLVGAIDPCGQCEVCRRGGGTVCPRARHRGEGGRGTLATRITVAARWVIPLAEVGLAEPAAADEAPAEARLRLARCAALAGDATLAYTAYARSDLAPKEPVVVLGASPVTRFLVEILLAKGIVPVVVVLRDATGAESGWVSWLRGRGAQVATVPDPDAPVDAARLHEARRGIAEALIREAPASASPAADGSALPGRPWRLLATEPAQLALAAALAGPRATITAVCASSSRGADDAARLGPALWQREVSVLGVAAGSPELILETAALAARGQLDLAAGTVVRPVAEAHAQSPDDDTRSLIFTL